MGGGGQYKMWLALVGLILVGAVLVGILLHSPERPATPTSTASSLPPAAAPEPIRVTQDPTPAERIATAHTLKGALKVAVPMMTDTANDDSPGAFLLTGWAMALMRWSDVGVTKDETSFALVQKDPEEERGKRLCASGSIVEIHTQRASDSKYYDGRLLTGGGNVVRFFAVGSTGTLVAESWARVCGVVIGTQDYLNSGGGVSHAVALVGMFDLPENRKAVPAP